MLAWYLCDFPGVHTRIPKVNYSFFDFLDEGEGTYPQSPLQSVHEIGLTQSSQLHGQTKQVAHSHPTRYPKVNFSFFDFLDGGEGPDPRSPLQSVHEIGLTQSSQHRPRGYKT